MTLADVYAKYSESPGTAVYSVKARKLFRSFTHLEISTQLTRGRSSDFVGRAVASRVCVFTGPPCLATRARQRFLPEVLGGYTHSSHEVKQVLQNLQTGETVVQEIPCPGVQPGSLLIRTTCTLISAGTERMLMEFGKANLLEKALQQPEKVRMALDKIKTDGLMRTIESVRNKLEQPLPIGYCNVGVVLEVGDSVSGFSVGDRVASNGKHAEVVCVPKNLCAKIPDSVSDDTASFTVIGAIALQGIRLAQPTLGETVVVTGLGLVGLVAVQLLRAHGCRVLGIDFDSQKLELARKLGAETVDLSSREEPVAKAMAFSRWRGADAVIITAATKSNEPIHQAAAMCRKRGRIVLIGVVGMELSRANFYEKELSFQMSCSYGPGRYDALYEEGGHDYPVGFVRWTEQRNFEAVLDMLADGRLDTAPLISHRFPFEQAEKAYELVAGGVNSLGILLQYHDETKKSNEELRTATFRLMSCPAPGPQTADSVVIGVIGSGSYATEVLIPAFKETSGVLKSIVSKRGVSGVHAGKKYGFEETTTDSKCLLEDPDINTVVVATRHDSHAGYVCQALRAGKHVFVEKPLAIRRGELGEIERVYREVNSLPPTPSPQRGEGSKRDCLTSGPSPETGEWHKGNSFTSNSSSAMGEGGVLLMVGFNRRFAPQVMKMKALLAGVQEPKSFVMMVNAGAIPPEHWTQDPEVGGGRMIGEACHFIDLLRFLADAPIESVQAASIGRGQGVAVPEDKVTFSMSFADGSFGTVHYFANGHKSFPKERLEVFCAGRILQLDNFRSLWSYGWPRFSKMNLWRQDKGHKACAAAFVSAIKEGKPSPIPFEELVEVTCVSFDIVDQLG